MTNPSNIFNYVPHDVTQHVLSAFLLPEERAAFNTVLEPTERVYKKFPKDFADKQALKIALKNQKFYATLINYFTQCAINGELDMMGAGLNNIVRYVNFLKKPLAVPLFSFKADSKERIISDLNMLIDEDSVYYDFMTHDVHMMILNTITFLKKIK